MKTITLNGRFYRAEQAKLRIVATVWSAETGGEILDYVDLGQHLTEQSVFEAVADAGLSLRERQCALGAIMGVTIDNKMFYPDGFIATWKAQ